MSMSDVYPFYNIRTCPAKVAGHSIKEEYQFYFKSTKSKLKYCVQAVNHSEDFFAIKFYCTSHKLSKNKYSLHTNTFEVFKIIDSCLQVIPILIAKHPGSSFVAVGSRSIIDDIVEPTANNRRYQLYRQKLIDFFGDREDYLMIMLPDMSGLASIYVGDQTGLSLRRKQQQRKFKISKIKKVVLDCYDDIQNIEI